LFIAHESTFGSALRCHIQ